MRKLNKLSVFLLLLLLSGKTFSQIVIADWDNKKPKNAYVWAGTLTQDFANPAKTVNNASDLVLKYVRPSGNYKAFHIDFDATKLIINPVFSILVYMPKAADIRVDLRDEAGAVAAQVTKNVTTVGSWVEVSFDFAGLIAPSKKYNGFELYPDPETTTTSDDVYYFDYMVFKSGFTSTNDAVIAIEKFAGYPNPWDSYEGNVSSVASFTCKNGKISNQKIKINRYPGCTWPASSSYPEPSKVAVIELGTGGTIGQTDTIILSDVNVEGFTNYRICFTNGGYYNTLIPNVFVKADNSDWAQLSYTNLNVTNNEMATYDIPTNISSASKLAVKLACQADWAGFWIDDIGFLGTPIRVTSITVSGVNTDSVLLMGSTLQMKYNSSPNNALDTTAVWSVVNGTGSASINAAGLLTPILPGTVIVKATANDGSNIIGEKIIHIYYPITNLVVSGTSGATTISENNGTLQMMAAITPGNAMQNVTWSIAAADVNKATISSTGLLTALRNGTVGVIATAKDGSGFDDTLTVTLSNQIIEPTALTIANATVNMNDQVVQMQIASSIPSDADKSVIWSIDPVENDTAVITASGLLTPIRNGKVTVKATSTIPGVNLSVSKEIIITGQVIEVISVTITSGNSISTNNGTLLLTATVLPADAINTSVLWNISSIDTDTASLTGNTLTAIRNGKVMVKATSAANNAIYAEKEIAITNQVVELQYFTINGNNITVNGGTSQMSITPSPHDAQNINIVWSLANAADSAKATISSTGFVEAFRNGTITVVAKDLNTQIMATKTISILGQVLVSDIIITGAGGANTITTNAGQLQMSAQIIPADARIKTVSWSTVPGTGNASITQTGLVTALANGRVWVRASSVDGSNVSRQLNITISGQVLVETVDIVNSIDIIDANDGTLTLAVNVLPANAADKSLTWSIESADADTATIDPVTGRIKALRNGTITVRATSNSNPLVYDEAEVVISNQVIEPFTMSIRGQDNVNSITTNAGTLQMIVDVTPLDAVKLANWSIAPEDIQLARINTDGLVTALQNGFVTINAFSSVSSTVTASTQISISGQSIRVISVDIKNPAVIETNDEILQLTAQVYPINADTTTVTWSLVSADADTVKLIGNKLRAIRNGKATIRATADGNNAIFSEKEITIRNQIIEPGTLTIKGKDGVNSIIVNNDTLQMEVEVTPSDAVPDVIWSLADEDSILASITSTGLLTAIQDGNATVIAISSVSSTLIDSIDIALSNQLIEVTGITISTPGGATGISTDGGSLQLTAIVEPANASDKTVNWSISDESIAGISIEGLVTALENGEVIVKATANDGFGAEGSINLSISGQSGISQQSVNRVDIFPNPVKNRLYFKQNIKAEHVEISGANATIISIADFNSHFIDVQDLPPGIYFVRIITGNTIQIAKFIKH